MMTLVSRLRTAAHLDRLRILGLCAHAALTVSDLADILDLRRDRVVRHIRLLAKAGFLCCDDNARGVPTMSKQEAGMAVWHSCWSISCLTPMAIMKETYNDSKQYETQGRKGRPA
ncbi:hypothetical protein AU467_34355 [Mesorhizobium loti]|uniref:Uncharacterized protein n=1 Tax=Rhizobium loti TaxID=381 RepID=A0A101KLP7_RHILI|nr:hypothetical protein AU467_34355 [Mesorhizobium loti]